MPPYEYTHDPAFWIVIVVFMTLLIGCVIGANMENKTCQKVPDTSFDSAETSDSVETSGIYHHGTTG